MCVLTELGSTETLLRSTNIYVYMECVLDMILDAGNTEQR